MRIVRAVRALAHRPSRVALILALGAGVAVSILTPPEMGGDEGDHFTRAYQLSTGSFLTHRQADAYGAYLPKSFQAEEARLGRLSYSASDRTAFLGDLGQGPPGGPRVFVSAGNAASYGPGAYIDYAPAIAFGRLLGLSTLALLYLARLAGAVAYALLLALAVKRMPVRPWVLVGVGLLPTAVNQASTVSADGMTMVLSFLIVAEALRLGLDETAPRRRLLLESAAASAALALAKPPYLLLVVLFALPAWRHRRALARPLAVMGVGAVVLAAAWGRYQMANSASQDNRRIWLIVRPDQYAFHGIRTGAQTAHLLSHPLSFLMAVGRTLAHQGLAFPKQLFGMLALYQLPWTLVVLAVVFLAVACVAGDEQDSGRLGAVDRVWLIAVSLAVVLAIFAIAYTNWNQYRAPRIDAVNTRYLLPILPALLLGLLPPTVRMPAPLRWSGWRYPAMALAAVMLVGSVMGLRHFHYSHPYLPGIAAAVAG